MLGRSFVEENLPKSNNGSTSGQKSSDSQEDLTRLEKLVSAIEKNKLDVTEDYKDWIKVGFILTFLGEKGRDYFHRFSQFYNGYTKEECDLKFDNLLKTSKGKRTLDHLFWHCKKFGYDIPNNEFPVESFPEDIQCIIQDLNSDLNFPTDYTGGGILVAAATAIGNTHVIEVKKGYVDHPILWLACVGPPGANKTHPVSFAVAPIQERDKESYRLYKSDLEKYEILKDTSKKDLMAAGETEKPQKPKLKLTIVSDTTPEALAEIMESNPRGGLSYNDELPGWVDRFNRYSSGGEVELWNSMWSAKPVTITRKTTGNHMIFNPFMCVLGTIQNGILKGIFSGKNAANGFKDRMLFAFPESAPKEAWTDRELSDNVKDDYSKIINRLLDLPVIFYGDDIESKLVVFSKEAKAKVFEWQAENAERINDEQNEGIKSIYGKIETYAMRIALTLHMLHVACGEEKNPLTISLTTWEKTQLLAEYFRNTALKTNELILKRDVEVSLNPVLLQVYQALPDSFKFGDGLKIAQKFKQSNGKPFQKSKFQRFVADSKVFKKLDHGKYKKYL